MELEEAAYVDLLKPLSCPEDAAFMEWTSGLLCCGRAFDSVEDFNGLSGEFVRDRRLLKSVTHENFHFFQFVIFGWAYRWASRTSKKLIDSARDVIGTTNIKTYGAMLSQLRRSLPNETKYHIAKLTGELDSRGLNSLSVKDLIESQAFYVESRIHYPDLNPETYLKKISSNGMGRIYRRAYDICRYRIGDQRAFDLFPAMVSASLCTKEPVRVFDALLDDACSKTVVDPYAVIEKLAMLPDELVYGSSFDVHDEEGLSHVVFDTQMEDIADLLSRRPSWMRDFFVHPHDELQWVAGLHRPMIFGSHNTKRVVSLGRGMTEDDLLQLVALASISLTVLSALEPEPLPESDPVGWTEHPLPVLFDISISPNKLSSCDLSELPSILIRSDGTDEEKRVSFWNRTVLSFDVDDSGILWERTDVRRFVSALNNLEPAFPLFFDSNPDFGMFLLWYGAMVDQSALHGPGAALDIGHPSALGLLEKTLHAIESIGDAHGWDMRLPVAQLVSVLPRSIRVSILEAFMYEAPIAIEEFGS